MSEIMEENEMPRSQGVKRKRKQKRSANQMLKKLSRRRDKGFGNELDTDTYQYMCRIMEVIRTDFIQTAAEDKLIFANNVHEQTKNHEIDLAKNQVGALVLDKLMKYINLESIERLTTAFTPSLRPLCSDTFASHVVERIIQVCADRGSRKLNNDIEYDIKIEITDDEIDKYNNIALKFCRYVINNFEEFVWEQYPNFVMRKAIECLGGLIERKDEQGKKKSTPTFEKRRVVVQDYTTLLVDATNRFLNWPQFPEFGKDALTSPLLQTIAYTLKDVDPKLCSKFIKKIKKECFTANDDDNLSNVFNTENSMRLIEVCLSSSNEKMYKKLYEKFFSGNIKRILEKENGNFCIQRLLDSCPNKENFEPIYDEISGLLSDLLGRNHTGVLSSLANACLRVQAKQGPFVTAISQLLGCDASQDSQQREQANHFVPLIARLVTWEQYQSAKRGGRDIPLSLHGSLIVQAILKFNKPIKAVNSILAMPGDDCAILFSDPKGSRILDEFMDSKFVGEKSREKLGKQLKGYWYKLAIGIHGSRCLDKIWKYSKGNQKNQIMEELAAVGHSLTSTKSGAIISAKLNVPLFARSRKDWNDAEGKEQKTKALFADIIGTPAPKSLNDQE